MSKKQINAGPVHRALHQQGRRCNCFRSCCGSATASLTIWSNGSPCTFDTDEMSANATLQRLPKPETDLRHVVFKGVRRLLGPARQSASASAGAKGRRS